MQPFVKVEREGSLLVVTLDRPDKHNALHASMHSELEQVWNDYFADPTLRVAILTGAGESAFCAGSDLSAVASSDGPAKVSLPPHGYAGLTGRVDSPKPVIAAVNGLALGGGFEVMLCCDLAVASENAVFGLPEPLVGAAALGGGIPRLCRKIPYTQAMTLLLTGDRIDAREALRLGLVSAVVPRGEALRAARALAAKIIRCAPLAIESTLAVANATLRGDPMADILHHEDGPLSERMLASEDLKEGVAAFFGKRAPVWKGR